MSVFRLFAGTWSIVPRATLVLLFLCVSACAPAREGPNDGAPDAGDTDAGTPPAPEGAPPTTPVSLSSAATTTMEAEPSVAVAPNGDVAVVWLGGLSNNTFGVGYTFSRDRGDTWEPVQFLKLDAPYGSANATVVADAQNGFHLSVLGVNYATSAGIVAIADAAPSATTFGPASEASDPEVRALRDAPSAVVAREGSLNVVYSQGESGTGKTHSIIASRSTDRRTWTRTTLIDQSGVGWPAACADRKSNRIAAVYVKTDTTVGVALGEDGGATWTAGSDVTLPDRYAEFPSCVLDGDDLWVLQARTTGTATFSYAPTAYTILLARSRDGGRTFEQPIAVEDPDAGPKYMRALGFVDGEGALRLAYYAGVSDNDRNATLRISRSTDRGATFEPSTTLFGPLKLSTSRNGRDWLGDLLGVASDSGNSFVAFVNNASGTSEVQFVRLRP